MDLINNGVSPDEIYKLAKEAATAKEEEAKQKKRQIEIDESRKAVVTALINYVKVIDPDSATESLTKEMIKEIDDSLQEIEKLTAKLKTIGKNTPFKTTINSDEKISNYLRKLGLI